MEAAVAIWEGLENVTPGFLNEPWPGRNVRAPLGGVVNRPLLAVDCAVRAFSAGRVLELPELLA